MNSPLTSLYGRIARRIKNKILFSVLAVFIVIYGITLSYVYNRIKEDLLQSARQEAKSTTQVLAINLYRNYERPIENDSRKIQSDIQETKKLKSNLLEINVLNRDLEIVSSTNEDNLFETASGQRYTKALENTISETLLVDRPEPFIHLVHPVSAGTAKDNYADGILEIKFSLKDQFADLASIRTNTLVAGVFILLAIAVVVTLISQSITKPIHNLYAGMGQVNEAGDLHIQVPVVSQDEIGYLTSTFNDMIDSIRISNERIVAIMESSRRFVPDQFISALGKKDITDVDLGDAILRNMTVFFMDIRGFTKMSGQMSADENLIFLNSLLESILPPIKEHNGFIDKYIGDAVMALFPDRPDDALLAAIGLRQRMAAFNKERSEQGHDTVDVGVGINSGELILGTVGSPSRIDTTVIGSTVNIASRLESLTKELGAPIILPEKVFLALEQTTKDNVEIRNLGPIKIRGVENEVVLTGVLA
jgi:class 3 adenylate cyclase/HAMP domain-containing protein